MNLKKGLVGMLAATALFAAGCGSRTGAGGNAANEDEEVTLGRLYLLLLDLFPLMERPKKML